MLQCEIYHTLFCNKYLQTFPETSEFRREIFLYVISLLRPAHACGTGSTASQVVRPGLTVDTDAALRFQGQYRI